jgi:formate hydrogenlyase subunit 3/multisubunit Na+/H+ antiporter MnhD subunit
LVIIFLGGLYINLYPGKVPSTVPGVLSLLFCFIGMGLVLASFAERGTATRAWFFILGGQLFITLSIALLNASFDQTQVLIYLSGTSISGIVGFVCLLRIRAIDQDINLDQFHGYSYEQPIIGLAFLVSCLGLAGLPFTPTFIGIDLLFSHVGKRQVLMIVVLATSFVFIEISLLRIYGRIFMGQHKKMYHPVAFRSS